MASLSSLLYIPLINVVRTTASASYTHTEDRNPLWLYTSTVYDQVTNIYFEATLRVTSGDTGAVTLSTVAGVDVTGAEVTTTSTTNVVVRSGDIEANLSSGTTYRARWKRSAGTAGNVSIDCARVIIQQSGAVTKLEHVIEIAEDNNVPSTSYSAPADYAVFLYTAAEYNGTVAVYLEADLHNNSSGDTTYGALYDLTAGSQVSSSEVSHTGDTTTTRKRSGAITLVDGHSYRADIKGTSTSDDVNAVKIIIQQSGTPTTATFYIPVLNTVTSGTTTTYTYQNRIVSYSASEWSGDTETDSYEATLKVSVGSETGTYNLYNDTDTTELAAATTTATAYTRNRDTTVTLPTDDSNVLNSGRKVSVGAETVTVSRSYIIKKMTWSSSTAHTKDLDEVVTITDILIKTSGKVISEVTTLVDTVTRSSGKVLVDVVTIVDTIVRTSSRAFLEAITIVDTVANLRTAVLTLSNEVVTLVDDLLKTTGKVLAETVTIVDSINRTIGRLIAEAITLVDSVSKAIGKIIDETLTIVDSLTRAISRVIDEVVTLVDSIMRQTTKVLSSTITIEDVVEAASSLITAAFTEVVTVVDTVTRSVGKILSEVVTVVDSLIKTVSRLLSEAVTLVITFVTNTTYSAILSQAITIVDTTSRATGKLIQEVVSLSESLGLTRTLYIVYSEILTVVDATIGLFKRARGIIRGRNNDTGTIIGTRKKR